MEDWIAKLALESDHEEMVIDLEEEEDWLDDLVKTDMRKEDTLCLESRLKSVCLEDQPLEDMEIVVEEDFLTWLMAELRGMAIEEEVLECIRTMACPGNCACEEVEECINTVYCPGNCDGKCNVETATVQNDEYGSIMQTKQSSTQSKDMHCVHCPDICSGACKQKVKPDEARNSHSIFNSREPASVTSSNNVYNDQYVQTNGNLCSEESTISLCTDPVNVVQPDWKSIQVNQGSGVFRDIRVKSS